MGGVKVDGPLLGIMLAKRAQIRATTLLSRSLSYKGRLCEEFWNDHKGRGLFFKFFFGFQNDF